MPHSSTSSVSDTPLPTIAQNQHSITEHYDRAVTIKVGRASDAKIFDIYRGVLQFYSGYFRVAIKNLDEGKFGECQKGMIELPDDEVSVFENFKLWLYAPNHKIWPGEGFDWQCLSFLSICKLWCFGEARVIPSLQNRTIDLLVSKMSQGHNIHVSAIRYAYEMSVKESHLRRLIIFYLANAKKTTTTDEEWPPKDGSTWFLEFAQDLALHRVDGDALPEPHKDVFGKNRFTSAPNTATWDRCAYHVHQDGWNCGGRGWRIIGDYD